jgi:hypothetical protein
VCEYQINELTLLRYINGLVHAKVSRDSTGKAVSAWSLVHLLGPGPAPPEELYQAQAQALDSR